MKLHTASILCLSLMSSILSLGCVASTEEELELEDSDAIEESDLGTAESELTLGGVDLNAACKLQYTPFANVTLTQPPYSTGAAYAWRCELFGGLHGIDVSEACRVQYLLPVAYAVAGDPNNAYSWRCEIPF
jgi:hypothetical protein